MIPQPCSISLSVVYNPGVPPHIVATKLYVPPLRPKSVGRARLIGRLDRGLAGKLTLISAPAGFGKTTLATEWIAGCGRPAAWLSLDEGDGELKRFLTCLVAALQTIGTDIGAGVLAALSSPQPPPAEPMLTVLLNEAAAIPEAFILVLDDYHVIDAKPVDEALAFMLEHLPPRMHLVIATREDPDLPIARLRAGGKLTEIRASDLRFTPGEAAEFLNQVMGLDLSAEDVAALESRTEGWIAGLQMAALSLQGTPHADGFIRAFTGSHRFVLDYLVEEVLQRQSEQVRNFLLQTAILDRLCGPLCDAVTGQDDGRGTLETLERRNLFVAPLDDERRWYRYHRLFADVLLARATEEKPDGVSDLHRRASEWYERNELPEDAIRHALAARDFGRAADLIELAFPAMDAGFRSAEWLGWVKALPDEVVRSRPVLSAGYAWALLDGGDMETCEPRLQDAERRLGAPSTGTVVADQAQLRSLPASIATARAYRALALGGIPDTVKYARQALELAPGEDHQRRGAASSLLGLAQYAGGDLAAAERSLEGSMAEMRESGGISEAIGVTFLLADIRTTLGRLREAENAYRSSLRLALDRGEPLPLATADLYRGIGELCLERGDLEAAMQNVLTGKNLAERAMVTDWRYRLCATQARICEAQGNLDGAMDLLEEAERHHIRTPLPEVKPLAAMKARLLVRQGRLAEAMAWVRRRGLSADDEPDYLGEFEHVTLARVLMARNDGGAIGLLKRLLGAAEEGGRMGSAMEILVLLALAHKAQGGIRPAFASLERALALAEPEGYVRTFVDEGPRMAELLTEMPGKDAYARTLLAAFEKPKAARDPALAEPLSERELDVLRMLRSDSNGPEIARKLYISLNTMRTHTKNIFSKLGVNNRRAAVRRAEELELL